MADIIWFALIGCFLFLLVRAIEIGYAVRAFRRNGILIRQKDIILDYYHLACGCGHPAYYLDFVGAGSTFKPHFLVRGKWGEPPPYCHKCLRQMVAICVCGKIILPEEKIALCTESLMLLYEELHLKIEFKRPRIICENCADKLPGYEIELWGTYAPRPEMPFIEDVIFEKKEHRPPKITHTTPTNQLH